MLIGVLGAFFATRNDKNGAKDAAAATTTSVAAAPGATCPLTGTPAPGGVVPARPALGVKIGNYPGDRPSAGLNQADIVFEEPVEGAITRLLAVFQCQGAPLVGDLRSARAPDVGILSQLSDPLFVHAGGIDPVIALLASAPLIDDNLYSGDRGSAIIQQPGRVAPYATFVNTAIPVGVQSFGQQASGAHLPLHVGAAHGSGGRFGGQRPHPVLLDIRRDLDVEPVGGLRAVLRRVARHAARRRRRPRRPTS